MAYAYDAAEISDLAREAAAAERAEYFDALRESPRGTCPDGEHRMVPDRRGGGSCACGATVSADEL